MRKIRIRPAAARDVDAIWDYTADEWGLDQADAYALDIRNAIKLIAINPFIGNDSSTLSDGLRKFNVGSHAIYYLNIDDVIDVVRTLHQRMDPAKRL